jgi:hypothetical protein
VAKNKQNPTSTRWSKAGELTFGEGDVLLGLAHDVHRIHPGARRRVLCKGDRSGRKRGCPAQELRMNSTREAWNRRARVRRPAEGRRRRGEREERNSKGKIICPFSQKDPWRCSIIDSEPHHRALARQDEQAKYTVRSIQYIYLHAFSFLYRLVCTRLSENIFNT